VCVYACVRACVVRAYVHVCVCGVACAVCPIVRSFPSFIKHPFSKFLRSDINILAWTRDINKLPIYGFAPPTRFSFYEASFRSTMTCIRVTCVCETFSYFSRRWLHVETSSFRSTATGRGIKEEEEGRFYSRLSSLAHSRDSPFMRAHPTHARTHALSLCTTRASVRYWSPALLKRLPRVVSPLIDQPLLW